MPAQTSALARLALDWLNTEPRARLILSLSLDVLWTNAAGQAALEASPGVAIMKGRLSFARRDERQRFLAFLDGLGEAVSTFALPFPEGRGHTLFRGAQLGEDGWLCLEVIIDRPGARPHLPDVDNIFGLTKSEVKIVAEMMGGQSVAQIAHAQDLSIDTVRSHVRAAYNKIGANTKEQLFSRLINFKMS